MERTLFILNFISTCFCIFAAFANFICLYKPNDFITLIVIISSFSVIALVAISELIISILLCQGYAFFILKIALCSTMVILNIIVMRRKMKRGDFKKQLDLEMKPKI